MLDCVTVFTGLLLVQIVCTNPDRRKETGDQGIGCIGAHNASATTLYALPLFMVHLITSYVDHVFRGDDAIMRVS